MCCRPDVGELLQVRAPITGHISVPLPLSIVSSMISDHRVRSNAFARSFASMILTII
jgi:hypothetical protein